MKIYLSKEVSKKTGNEYLQMYADTGYGLNQIITMDKNVIVNLLDVTPSKLSLMCPVVAKPVLVANFDLIKDGGVK